MRATNLAGTLLVAFVAAVAVFAIRQAVSGGTPPPLPTAAQVTPLPSEIEQAIPAKLPDPDATPRPCHDYSREGAVSPEPVRVTDIDVPLPRGAGVSLVGLPQGQTWGPEGPPYIITCGASVVTFDALGVFPSQTQVQAEDADLFKATLDALARLGQRPEPTPPPILIGDFSIPVPMTASIGSAVGGDWGKAGPPWIIKLGASFVRFDLSGVLESSIEQVREAEFAPSLSAIEQMSASTNSETGESAADGY